MHRREFIAALAGTVGGASAFGLRSTSVQAEKVRRIGVLMGGSESDIGEYFAAFVGELGAIGLDGRPQRAVRAAVDKRIPTARVLSRRS
jgi:hypothetical protein